MEKDIRRLYRTYWKREHIRLTRDAYHSLELKTTLMFLRKYLPRKGLVLDAGTGGGAYALRLAKDRKAWGNWVKVHNALCTNPIVVGVSAHILLVARKKR